MVYQYSTIQALYTDLERAPNTGITKIVVGLGALFFVFREHGLKALCHYTRHNCLMSSLVQKLS